MKKKIQWILNIIMGCFVGVFIGSGLYKYWYFLKHSTLSVNCSFVLSVLSILPFYLLYINFV